MHVCFIVRIALCFVFLLASSLALEPHAIARDTTKARQNAKPGGFLIEATGEAPELSDVAVEPWTYIQEQDEALRAAGTALLEMLSDPYAVLGLPESSLEPSLGGLVPLQREEESTQREGFDQ